MAQAMQVQEKVNRARTGELWQAKAGLEKFRTQQVQSINTFADAWVGNQAGIRDTFTGALNTLQMHWLGPGSYDLQTVLPPGTESYQCELALSGHMVLPCCEYQGADEEEAGQPIGPHSFAPSLNLQYSKRVDRICSGGLQNLHNNMNR